MRYWDMQLHPDWKEWGKEIELLESKGLIGLGTSKSDISYINFKNDMQKDDVVLIKRGAKVLALVQVVGECEDVETNNEEKLDWFRYRRKVKILSTATKGFQPFPQPRKTLQKLINRYTLSYKYVDNWFLSYKNKKPKDVGFKLHSIKIDNFKLFHNFEIDFLDENNKPLSLVVIVGKNGTGKTTLFDYICEEHQSKYQDDNIIYMPATTPTKDDIESVDKLILEYIDHFIYDRDFSASVGYENLQNDIDEIFEEFDLSFKFDKINAKNKKVLFTTSSESQSKINFDLETLSTGEKTLIFKILKLYLQQAKDKVILIDEPELSLHPSWQNKVISIYEKFAKINNNQIIIATHSPHILSSIENQSVRVLRKDSNGNIEVIKHNIFTNGRDINSVLFDVMGEVRYRPDKFEGIIDDMYKYIDNNDYNNAFKIFEQLKEKYGENDTVIIEAKMALNMMKQDIK